MEQPHRYHDDRQYAGGTDHYIQPAWLCMPQIKVENEIGVHRCQPPQYDTSSNHSASSGIDYSQNSLDCNTPYSRNGPSLNVSSSEYSNNRSLISAEGHDDASCSIPNHSSTDVQRSTTAFCHDTSLDQENEDSRYPPSAEVKNSKTQNSVPWYVKSLHSERLQVPDPGSDKPQICSTSQHSQEKMDLKNSKSDESEPKQAFDLTCRNKSPSKEEESSSNDSQVTANDEAQSTQMQARCSPKHQTCKVCGKVLSSASSYYVHMKVHSGHKPYACTMCEASFCRKPYLEVHMRTHTGERPFECGTCNKRFTQKSSLNTHKRVHTGERPYSCDICQKTFAVKSYVTAHRWSHVSEKPFGCQRCGLTFTSKNLFTLHIRTHTDQNHECHICGRTFMKDSYLIRHQNRVHRDTNTPYTEINQPRSPRESPPNLDSTCASSSTS